MKKHLVTLGIFATLASMLVAAHTSQAYVPMSEAVDIQGRQLADGDLISASQYGDPDIFIIKFAPVPGVNGFGEIPDEGSLGYKRLFLNPAIFNMYGHLGGFERVHQVTPRIRDAFTTSGLFRNCETNDQHVWAIEVMGEDDGVLHHVEMTGDQARAEDPYFFHKVFCINSREDRFYARSIYPYRRLADVPRYDRHPCRERPACLDADNTSAPRCSMPEPAEGWCPRPTPTPTRGPTISSVSVTTAAPGMRVTLRGSGFSGYRTGPGGFTDQVVLSGYDGGTWTYATDIATDHLTFTVPETIFPSPCTGDPDENCTRTTPLIAGHYFIRVVIRGDGLPRMVSNTADIDLRGCNPRPACLDSEPRCLMPEPAEGWCPRPTPGPCYVGGCSNQLCTDRPDAVSTCEYRPEYACYQYARCERQSNGSCGWSSTDQYQQCRANVMSGY